MNTHVVTKPFSSVDGPLEVGAEVDASEWKNTRLLVEQRFLQPLDGVTAPPISERFSSEEAFESQVIAIVSKNIRQGGELAQLIQPNGREQRMGRKDQQNAKQGN